MKRDFDLIRIILRDMEAAEPMRNYNGFSYGGHEQSTIIEHIELLVEAGLLKGEVHRHGSGGIPDISRLTWAGHDFLDAIKDESIWMKAHETVLKPIGGASFDVLLEWLKWKMKDKLGMPTE